MKKRFTETVAVDLGITAIKLFVAFRSLLVPIKAVLLNLLSVGGAFGLTVLVFQHGYGGRLFGLERPTEAIWGGVPVLGVATGVGLPMAYEGFLLRSRKAGFEQAGRHGPAHTE